jgi:type I restriction enzyme S subunit
MSKIDELIKKHCPDGVEFRTLGEVCEYVRGITYSKVQEVQSGKGTMVLRANNITLNTNTLNFDDVKVISSEVKIKDRQKLKANDILICAASGSKEHIGKVAFISADMNYVFGGFMAVLRTNDELGSRFLFHLLVGNNFSKYLETTLNSATINNLNSSIMNAFLVPIPPIEVQKEIAKILDKFTQLEAELEARRWQYEHYRNSLLTFGGKDGGRGKKQSDVEWRILGEVCEISRGVRVVKSQLAENGKYPVYQNCMTPLGYFDKFNCSADTTFVICGGAAGQVGFSDVDFWAADDCLYLICSKELQSKYLYHSLLCKQDFLLAQVRKASVPRLSRSIVEKLQIPIPPLPVQQKIVKVLDKFESLTTSISEGLPAEIKARHQQYEYYHNKLLTFRRCK